MAWRDEISGLNHMDGSDTLYDNTHSDSHNTARSVLQGISDDPGFAVVSDTAPDSPVDGQLWYDLNVDFMKRWDGTNSVWVVQGSQASEVTVDPANFTVITTNDSQSAFGDLDNDVDLNNTHRGSTSNPHSVTAAQAGAVENVSGVISFHSDTRANQPAAGTAGRFYHVTDEDVIEYDNGTSWIQVIDLAHRNDTANPHNVTAAQTSAVALADVEDGAASFSGDGTTTTFTVSHGLGSTPNVAFVQATSVDARDNSPVQVTNKTSTGFDVVFATAPPSGTDNIGLDYHARL